MVRTLLFAALMVLAGSNASVAQDAQRQASTTRLVPFAGVLTDAAGAFVSGSLMVTFSLFDERDGGTLLWTETQEVIADERGRYTAHLGASTVLPLEIFRTERARWLEVTVDGRAQPRAMLVAVPYALRAADAETLGGKPLSELVLTDGNRRRVRGDGTSIDDPTVDGSGVANQIAKWTTATTLSSSIITESFDNRIGILAPDPTGGGVVDSRFTVRHLDNNTAIAVLNTSNQRRFALNTLAIGGWTLYDGGNATWNAGITQFEGSVAVGGPAFSSIKIRAVGGTTATGVVGSSSGGRGIEGRSTSEIGVSGFSQTGMAAVLGQSQGTALAGLFNGDVDVNGTLTKNAGSFRIDHPLDPANKYLSHSFVESPDMMNVYNGNVVLDAQGEAWVTLPDWFEALNRDFRYQLTPIGAPGPNLYVAAKISANRFKIAGGVPFGEVSWLVTGVRQDAFANAHRIPVEHDKPAHERGYYLHPAGFDMPATLMLPSRRVEPTRMRDERQR